MDYQDGFVELERPAAPALNAYFEALQVRLPQHYQTEINLDAIKWMNGISACLQKGFVMTIDYGGWSQDLYKTYKSEEQLFAIINIRSMISPSSISGNRILHHMPILVLWIIGGRKPGYILAGWYRKRFSYCHWGSGNI